ncbi:MAG: S49 family peptidase [Magnetococcales bacterium]|nr:S49 family peptidase [Magnetococcales bacterium]
MKTGRLLADFLVSPWALRPETLSLASGILSRWNDGLPVPDEVMAQLEADKGIVAVRRQSRAQTGGGIAVLPLYGVLTQRGDIQDVSGPGTTSLQAFASAFRQAMADPMVGGILIEIDSPGGSVFGTPELASEIMACRGGGKPIVAVANAQAASAAYWIGCAADELYCTPSGEVGSIGVWVMHVDHSKELEQDGQSVTLISAGKHKTEGNPYQELPEDSIAFLQGRVDEYYRMFMASVAKGRRLPIAQIRDGMGQGRMLGAAAALEEKMIDGVATFDEVVAMMRKKNRAPPARSGVGSSLGNARRRLALLQ